MACLIARRLGADRRCLLRDLSRLGGQLLCAVGEIDCFLNKTI
jgi:hypothetical protein